MAPRIAPLLFCLLSLAACEDSSVKEANGWACEETSTELSFDEVSALGFAPRAILDLAEGSHEATFTYADGATTTLGLLAYDATAARYVESTPPEASDTAAGFGDAMWDSGDNDPCPDRVEVDMSLDFATADGAFDEVWAMTMSSVDGVTVQIAAELDTDFAGSYVLEDHVTSTDWDELSAWVDGSIDASGTSGMLSAQASGSDDDCEPGEVCTAWAENVDIGTWSGEAAAFDTCADDLEAADASFYTILLAGDASSLALQDSDVTLIDDDLTWADFVASFDYGAEDLATASVDFATQQVVALQRYKSSTCGIELVAYGVQQNLDDTFNVYADLYDATGACEWTCDAEGQVFVVAAVARGSADATGCVSLEEACE